MADELTDKHLEWVERYAYAMNKAGALNARNNDFNWDTDAKGPWTLFKTAYVAYVVNVPKCVQNIFRWDKMLSDTFDIHSDLMHEKSNRKELNKLLEKRMQ